MIISASRKHATKTPGPSTGCRIRVYPINSSLNGNHTILYSADNKRIIYFWDDLSPVAGSDGGSGLTWETLNSGTVFTLTQE